MKTMKHLLSGFFIAAAIASSGLASIAPVNADTIEYDKYFIPTYQSLKFVDVAVTGLTTNTTFATLTDNGKVFTHGQGTLGQIGNGQSNNENTPIEITAFFQLATGDKIVDIEGGLGQNFYALSSLGRVYAWGFNYYGSNGQPTSTSSNDTPFEITSTFAGLATGEKIVDIRLGYGVTLFRTNQNKFFSLGSDLDGALGRISSPIGTIYNTPGLLKSDASTNFVLNVDEVFVDYGIRNRTGFIQTNKRLYTWGLGTSFLHLAGSQTNKNFVTSVSAITSALAAGETIRTAALGATQGILVTSANRIYVWGINSSSSLTKYSSAFGPIQTLTEITAQFYNEIQHYPGDFYTLLDENEYISKISIFDDTVFAQVNYIDQGTGTHYVDDYLAWGKNGTTSNNTLIGFYLGYLGTYDTGSTLGVPRYVGAYDTVSNDNEDNTLQIVNAGASTAIRTAEGGISFLGVNNFGQLGNGIAGLNFSSDLDRDFNIHEYYYVMSFHYEARNLQVNYIDAIDFPFTKETIDEYYENGKYWLVYEFLLYYYGFAETNYNDQIFAWYNLDDQGRSLLGTDAVDDISAAYFDYDVINYFQPYGFDVESLSDEGSYNRYWTRQWAEAITRYELDFGVDAYGPLSENAQAQVEDGTKTVIAQIQAMLDNVVAFENALKAFRLTVDIYDEDAFNVDNFKDYETDILALFEQYDDLSELEKLYFDVYNDYANEYDYLYGYYEDLRYYFIGFYVNDYENQLWELYILEDNYGYGALFDNIEFIKALLEKINELPGFVYDAFTEYDEYDDEYYYDAYYYWIYLSEIMPFIEEAKPVYDAWQDIEENLVYDDEEYIIMNRTSALAVLSMYQDFKELSEDATDTLEYDRIEYLYQLALEFLVYEVEDALYDIWDLEDAYGYSALFDNLDDVNAALALYEDLPEDALDYMDSDAIWYYEYLKGLQAALTEALPVYNMVNNLPSDPEDVTDEDIDAILAAIEAYNALSEDAKDLIDSELLFSLLPAAARRAIDNLPSVAELTLDDENDVEQARRAYDLLTEEQKEELGEDYLARLEAAEARIAELKQGQWVNALITMGVLLIHFAAAAYFIFLKRKDLAKLTGIKALAK